MSEILRRIIERNRAGEICAVPSVCSSHPQVLRASLMRAEALDVPLVIEATSNQVNQDGGYTGMVPRDFIAYVHEIAASAGVNRKRLVFGGDHLGPQVWRKGPAAQAMVKARAMVADYAAAGFEKIHLDCSEGCAGEPAQLGDALAAERAADLARVALNAAARPEALVFVIGTEVPPPGGARADEHGDIVPTTAESAMATLAAHAAAFRAIGLGQALGQVVGLVVQPGVEFSPTAVHPMPIGRDPGLRAVMMTVPNLCLEAHSTDYQAPEVYPRLAELGFAIQKVGPALTFAYREAIYALDRLRKMADWASTEPVSQVMERMMLAEPAHWAGHYHGVGEVLRHQLHEGLADRIRYYWPKPEAVAAVAGLMADLKHRELSSDLLEQVFDQATLTRARQIGGALTEALVLAKIQLALDPYFLSEAKE